MRALAEFIMRGRAQACIVALLGNIFPFISPAAIGLVTLRKGSIEGVIVAMWAVLPLIGTFYLSEGSQLLTLVSVAALVMMVVSANVLRLSASWQLTMLVSVGVGMVTALSFGGLFAPAIDEFVQDVANVFTQMAEEQELQETPFIPGRQFILGLMAWMLTLSAIASLLVSRWWQALLYNPGGFQQEFHSLSLDSRFALMLLAAVIAGMFLPSEYKPWSQLLSVPLLICGLAMIHHAVKFLNVGGQWLGLLYFGLVFAGSSTAILLVSLGVADSILNLRSRLAAFKNR
ncbi:MAG: hypothetical protein P8M77_00820 [Porticoccaceae bacterium]|nr:hypothetical protein [Porticoccaceae bacterium]